MQNLRNLFIIIVVHAIIGCSATNKCIYTDYKTVEDEPLFRIYTKNMKSGTIEFISKNNNQISLTQFRYHVDIDKKDVTCYKSESSILKSTDERLNGTWMTADMFKHNARGPKIAYWKCFSEDLDELSNEEKLKLLEDLSKR